MASRKSRSSSSSNKKRSRASQQAASARPASPRAASPRPEEITLKSQTNYLRQTGTHEQMEDFEDIDDDGGCFYFIELHDPGVVLSCGSVLAESTRSNVLHFNMKFIFQDGQWISNKSAIHKGNIDSVFKCEFIGRGSAPAPNSVRTYASQTHPGVMNSFLYPPPIEVFKKSVPPPSPKRQTPKPPSPKRAEATRKRERPFPSSFNFDAIDPRVQRYFDMDLTVATQDDHNRLRKATAGMRHAISERFVEWVFDWIYYKAKRKDFNIDLDNEDEDINYDITLENVINVACDEIRQPHKKKIWLEELLDFLYHKSYWARMDRAFLYSPIHHFFKISHYEAESWGDADPGSYGPSQPATTLGLDIDGAYRILGIPPGSPVDVAKHAYRKLALKHHPDKGGDPEKLKELNEAWSNIQSSFE